MPRVPYEPYPSTQPISPGERLSVQTPGAAFGENIGAALTHLGATGEQVGGEIFQRAIALQELNNEAEARNLQVQFDKQTAPKVAGFSALEGKAARDGLLPHLDDLQKTRDALADSASNPMSRRMFLNDATPFLQREIFSASRHAGDQFKNYVVGQADATYKLNLDGLRKNPDDAAQWDRTIKSNDAITDQISTIRGESPEAAQYRKNQALSHAWAHRILGKNDTDPVAAEGLLEKNKDSLTDEDYAMVESRVRSQSRSIASTNIANDTLKWGRGDDVVSPKTVPEMVEHAKDEARKAFPDDPIVAQHAVTTLHGMVNVDEWERKKQRWTDVNNVETAIAQGDIQTIQQLRALPGMADTLGRLGSKYENDLPKRINNINNIRNQETNRASYERVAGLFNNDREEFLNTDLSKEHLSWTDYKYWLGKQAQAKEKVNDDPRVNRALSILRGSTGAQLEALGIFKRSENNKDDFDKFTGALSGALDSWQQDHGKPASGKDIIETIGPRLIQTHPEAGLFGSYTKHGPFGYDVPFYRQDTSTKEYKEWAEEESRKVMGAGGVEPSDEQLFNAYVRYQYIKQYGGKAKTEPIPGKPAKRPEAPSRLNE